MRKILIYLVLMVIIVGLDQYSKFFIQESMIHGESWIMIPGFFNITFVKNAGAAFGMGANALPLIRQLFFLLLPLVACCWLVYLIWTSRDKKGVLGMAYSLILAGAIGNLIDRFTLGHVIDFLDFYWRDYHFWTFNIADSSISIAAILIIGEFLYQWWHNRCNAKTT